MKAHARPFIPAAEDRQGFQVEEIYKDKKVREYFEFLDLDRLLEVEQILKKVKKDKMEIRKLLEKFNKGKRK